MASLASIKLDASLESGGVWVDFPFAQGVRFKVASYTNTAHMAAMREAHKAKERSQDEYDRLYADSVARNLIKDWSGLDDGPYAYAQALEFATLPEFRHVKAWVETVAMETGRYLVAARAEAGKA